MPFDAARHNAYLDVIIRNSQPLGGALERMGTTAGSAARTRTDSDLKAARVAFTEVEARARAFLDALNERPPPPHFRKMDEGLQEAVKAFAHGAQRGVRAVDERDGSALARAARQLHQAGEDVVDAARQIVEWRR